MPLPRVLRLLRNALLCLGAALAASSCTMRREGSDESVGRSPSALPELAAQEEMSAAPVPPPNPEAPILTLADYKVAVARRIAQSNADHFFEGAPPPMLKSVVVLTIAVDDEGSPVRVRLMRGNGHRALEQLAMQSVKVAAPLPRPGMLARRGVAEFNETWLFRQDGRFQLRSTAELQADS